MVIFGVAVDFGVVGEEEPDCFLTVDGFGIVDAFEMVDAFEIGATAPIRFFTLEFIFGAVKFEERRERSLTMILESVVGVGVDAGVGVVFSISASASFFVATKATAAAVALSTPTEGALEAVAFS